MITFVSHRSSKTTLAAFHWLKFCGNSLIPILPFYSLWQISAETSLLLHFWKILKKCCRWCWRETSNGTGESFLEIYLNRWRSVQVESSPVYLPLVFPLNRTFVMVNLWLSSILYSYKESVSTVQRLEWSSLPCFNIVYDLCNSDPCFIHWEGVRQDSWI